MKVINLLGFSFLILQNLDNLRMVHYQISQKEGYGMVQEKRDLVEEENVKARRT